MEEIWVNNVTCCTLSCEIRSIEERFDEYICLNARVVNRVVTTYSLSDSWFKDWYIVDVIVVKLFYKGWQVTVIFGINSECFKVVHVVNITP